ncbi:MAG TPA: hypothetical protein DCF96_06570 [Rhodobacteraceae bacterium]|nr:hypothetical protein [Paracoccaceae bacterium]
MTRSSRLDEALQAVAQSSAQAMVARANTSHPGLNQALIRKLSQGAGNQGSILADPVFEIARNWKPATQTLGDMEGNLLRPAIVEALANAGDYEMGRELSPYLHQEASWRASLEDQHSVLVTAGTGSGKTESFMIPILQDIISRPPRPGGGIQAILLYPLNALIESQRDRLSAWARGLGGRVRFALFNGDTVERENQAQPRSDDVELRSRNKIREEPPEILVTNITMLEYMLLRGQDRGMLEKSQAALRWIVIDEAHSYIGSQAAEMALLLRRVRAAFGVEADDVRLMATSATIGGEMDATGKLKDFASALSGRASDQVTVVEGVATEPVLPSPGAARPFDLPKLNQLADDEDYGGLWHELADHPRVLKLRTGMASGALSLRAIAQLLWDDPDKGAEAQKLLDVVALAEKDDKKLLPWRAHLFHRAQGGIWACTNPSCSHRDPELATTDAKWPFGAIYLTATPRCGCGAPVYEVVSCTECGTVHLQGQLVGGAQPRLDPPDQEDLDDYLLDVEPDDDEDIIFEKGTAWIVPGKSVWLSKDGKIFDNKPPEDTSAWNFDLVENASNRDCCDGASRARLMGFRFGPAFFLATSLPSLLEILTQPMEQGLPSGGRRAITFSDSRQGVARLAAKLQQDAERTLTLSYLWHRVNEVQSGDPEEVKNLEAQLAELGRLPDTPILEGIKAPKKARLAELQGGSSAVPWEELVAGFSEQPDLKGFVGKIWRNRWIDKFFQEDPKNLAEMMLFRELMRRPRVQNNPETMGLARLVFLELEAKARAMPLPDAVNAAGITREAWIGLAQAAVDFGFRQNLAVEMPHWMVGPVAPKAGVLQSMVAPDTPKEDMHKNYRRWPTAFNDRNRIVKLVYALAGGEKGDPVIEDRVSAILSELWSLIISTACENTGAGGWRLNFKRAAVERLETGWLCPVTRRPFGYNIAGRSPYAPAQMMREKQYPALHLADAGGLLSTQRKKQRKWIQNDKSIADLRSVGLWNNLHDRIAEYPRYIRAQEHSAQIPRPVLARYEDAFGEGKINLLNCSTTMEMGVDIPAVQLVVNANVPPALSNYRQRVGRAGRRREPWAFSMTFCRDLPLDYQAFQKPVEFLERPIVAPKVWFDSAALIQRHVNAALLSQWFAEQGGVSVKSSIGAFMGINETFERAFTEVSYADRFLDDLRGDWAKSNLRHIQMQALVKGTTLSARPVFALIAQASDGFQRLIGKWREEYESLFDGMLGAKEYDVIAAYKLRAKRLAGEFMLGEFARRGFTPAYGFPTDVVSFTSLLSSAGEPDVSTSFQRAGGASRELHQALREYAPGNEVVIDGQVFESEGILPAWRAQADASKLEDLREFWACSDCHAFGASTIRPETCPQCGNEKLKHRRVIRPAGFLSAKQAHTGYELINRTAVDDVSLSAQGGDWIALPQEQAGRMRVDPAGQLTTLASGQKGGGFAICLDCGRAAPMDAPEHGAAAEIPKIMLKHKPLQRRNDMGLTIDGLCPGSDNPNRIQKAIHLAQITHTDIWEWQLPDETSEQTGKALAAALRESLIERLGVQAAEVGLKTGPSRSLNGDGLLSIYLFDRAAGGAGLSARMGETETFTKALSRAVELLDCLDSCKHGCPSCILRPDINQKNVRMDRERALNLAKGMLAYIDLPAEYCVLGSDTQFAGQAVAIFIDRALRNSCLDALNIWMHGSPSEWDLQGWILSSWLPRLHEAGVEVRMHFPRSLLSSADFDLSCRLSIHRFAAFAKILMADQMPQAEGYPVLATLKQGGETSAFVAMATSEATPGEEWGAGTKALVVRGNVPHLPESSGLSVEKLMELGSGNTKLFWTKRALDGAIPEFGNRFWKCVASHAPLEVNALKEIGLKSLTYSDRYLMAPLVISMLSSVLRATPGRGNVEVFVDMAKAEHLPFEPRMIWDNFKSDAQRIDVIQALLPGVTLSMERKNDLPHYRALSGELNDGRKFVMLLDQGFGAWRAQGTVRHDFEGTPTQQAKMLVEQTGDLASYTEQGAPIAFNFNV